MTSRLRPWAVAGLLLGAGGAWAQLPAASPSPSPVAPPSPPPSIRSEVDKQVERLLEREAREGVPRFETSIEVVGKSPQVMIERYFGGLDLECVPAGLGAPTVAEMGEARPTPPPTGDLLALAQLVASKLKGRSKGPDRYFLYRVRRGTEVRYDLRESKVPLGWLYGVNGTSFELVEGFPDRDSAVRGLRRMERGIPGPLPASPASPAIWASSPCRPRR